jgi:hypothetical protein
MAEESLIEKALEAILPKPRKRTAKKPSHSTQLAAVQKKLTQLSRDVEKLARMVATGGNASGAGAAKKTTSRAAKPARTPPKKTASRRKRG